jgi:hypothetical protein
MDLEEVGTGLPYFSVFNIAYFILRMLQHIFIVALPLENALATTEEMP